VPPILPGIAPLSLQYGGFILDVWGVIHDGVALFPGVADCLEQLHKRGKRFCMLTNAPRRAYAVASAMQKMGVPEPFTRDIVTSGEACHEALKARTDPWFARLGKCCLHIGPERDLSLLDGLDLTVTKDPAAADFIVNTGPWRDEETVADYEPVLAACAARRLPMVCANPDLAVVRGGKRIICAGALARRYEQMGGDVRDYGKPHPAIYDVCLQRLGIADRARVLAVGDSLRTDIAGAEAAGIPAALVLGGLHAEDFGAVAGRQPDLAKVEAACKAANVRPGVLVPAFTW
jgi:HAD superfamily hydrolase (TIGR01459 family)